MHSVLGPPHHGAPRVSAWAVFDQVCSPEPTRNGIGTCLDAAQEPSLDARLPLPAARAAAYVDFVVTGIATNGVGCCSTRSPPGGLALIAPAETRRSTVYPRTFISRPAPSNTATPPAQSTCRPETATSESAGCSTTATLSSSFVRLTRTHRNQNRNGRYRRYNDNELPDWALGGTITSRLNRTQNARPIHPTTRTQLRSRPDAPTPSSSTGTGQWTRMVSFGPPLGRRTGLALRTRAEQPGPVPRSIHPLSTGTVGLVKRTSGGIRTDSLTQAGLSSRTNRVLE